VSNELLGLTYFGMSETRTYNNILQLTSQSVPGMMNMQYIYTAGQNNGRVAATIDGYLPETVNYTYDSLNRLSNATATNGAWSQSYTYDGFGNLTSKSAAGFYPAYSATFNPANNRQNGWGYDANGNETVQGTFDVSNRLVASSTGQSYAYDYRGKRIVKWTGGTAELYFYGIDGKKLTTFTCDANLDCGSPVYNVSFAGKLVQSKSNTVVTDKLGSVRWTTAGGGVGPAYFPYGEERTIDPDDTEKFGTYTRDSSGQDYADQRYYGVGTGRFWSPDPKGMQATDSSNPTSWNLYAYVNGDPVNFNDPTGEDNICGPGMVWDGEGCTPGTTSASYANSPFSPSVTQSSIDLSTGEMSYVLGTVVPGYLSSAVNSDPNLQEIVFPNGGISAVIQYGPIAPSTLSGIASAVFSGATYSHSSSIVASSTRYSTTTPRQGLFRWRGVWPRPWGQGQSPTS